MKHADNMKIFQYGDNEWVTYGDIVNSLKAVEADCCEVLLLHTGITFGLPSKELNRKKLVSVLYDAITELGVKTLVFPTFTFSFPNGEVYDIVNSKTKMGMINEYARKLPNAVRTEDPLMSFCVIGENLELTQITGNRSLGPGSFFDNLHKTDNVNILFFGVNLEECYTYQHYVEERLRVPYRYDKEFCGKVIDAKNCERQEKYILYVKYRDIKPFTPPEFEQYLLSHNYYKKVKVGNSYISCFREKDAYRETKQWIENDINGFLAEPYDKMPLIKEYHYGNVTTVQ